MGAVIAFIIRLVGYGLLVGVPYRVAEHLWLRGGLDQVEMLRVPHDQAALVMFAAPFVLALFGFGALRQLAMFIALYLAGAALTAPFAFARLAPVAG
ncbi:MAG: hypothetical protein NVS2B17_15360 [Candidatus Velthaea sp.]